MLLPLFASAVQANPPVHALAEPLSSPAAAEVIEASDGSVWAAEDGIVQRLDPATGEWRSLGKLTDPEGTPALLPLPDGAMRVAETNRPDVIIGPDGRSTPADGDLSALSLLQRIAAVPGKLWSIGATGVWLYDVATGERTRFAEGSAYQTPTHAAANGDGSVLVWRPEETRRWSPDGTSTVVSGPPLDHPTAAASAAGWAWMLGAARGRVFLTGLDPAKDVWTAPVELPPKTGGFELWGLPDGRLAVGGADEPKIAIVDPRTSPPTIREVSVPWTALHTKVAQTSHGLLLLDGGRQDAWFDADRGAFVRSSPQVVPTAVLWSDRPLASNCPAGDRLFREEEPGLWVDAAATPMHRTTGIAPSPICPDAGSAPDWVATAPGLAWSFDAATLTWTSVPPPTATTGDVSVVSSGSTWSISRDAIVGPDGRTGPGPGFTPMFAVSPTARVVIAADLESEAVFDPKKSRWTPVDGAVHPDTMRVFGDAAYAIGSDHAVIRYDAKHRRWDVDPTVPAEVARDGAWLPAQRDPAGWRWIDADGLHREDAAR